ncbi:MAG: PD-(D/E)XK nuclease family protein [Candidatus Woesearchaeota archaeon]
MSDLQTIKQLLNEVQTISESYERVAEATGENFNIFSVLNMETDEVTTHSQFIAELLNPNGAHGQTDTFLKIFVNILSEREIFNKNIGELELSNTNIVKEKQIGSVDNINETGGYIDLLINAKHFKIIIENKIDAVDQYKQLVRYHNFLNIERNNKEKILLYLTLDGHSPAEDSIKFDNGDKLNAKEDFYCVSYENFIIKWLEECKEKAVDIPILRESITQYINLIKKLTNQNLNKIMSQDITNRVLKDKYSFKAFTTLVQSQKEVFRTVMNEVVFPFLREIERRYELKLELKENFFNNKTYSGFNFQNESLTKRNVKLFFEFQRQNHEELVFGFKYLKKDQKEKFNYDDLKEKFKNQFGNISTSKHSPCYTLYKGCQNWENLKHLEEIYFGDFKTDFEEKIQKMLDMV